MDVPGQCSCSAGGIVMAMPPQPPSCAIRRVTVRATSTTPYEGWGLPVHPLGPIRPGREKPPRNRLDEIRSGARRMGGCSGRPVLVHIRHRRCQAGGCSRHRAHRTDVPVPAVKRRGGKSPPAGEAGLFFSYWHSCYSEFQQDPSKLFRSIRQIAIAIKNKTSFQPSQNRTFFWYVYSGKRPCILVMSHYSANPQLIDDVRDT